MEELKDLLAKYPPLPEQNIPSPDLSPATKFWPVRNAPVWFNPSEAPVRIEEQFTHLFPLVKSWAVGQTRLWPGYLAHGPLGVGKTGLTLLLAYRSGRRSEFATVSEVVRSIKETWGPLATEQESEAILRWLVPDILVIDEIGGVQFGSQAERNALYDVVVGRYNRCKPTLLTTNCDLRDEKGQDEFYACAGKRIADRFQGNVVDAWGWGGSLRASKQE